MRLKKKKKKKTKTKEEFRLDPSERKNFLLSTNLTLNIKPVLFLS